MSNLKLEISKGFVASVVLMMGLTIAMPVKAQDQVRLSLSKAWGYSMGGQIQGLFNMSVSAPEDATSVRFELDGEEIATVTQPPFSIQFNTDKYPKGVHTFSATIQTSGGQTLKSNVFSAEFVSAEQGWQVAQRIIIPLAAVVIVAMLAGLGAQFLMSKRGNRRPEPGAPRRYGIEGGAICPKCGRPFARHLFSPNLLVGKLERCPYCGKWSVVPAASREALTAAEAAEVTASRPSVLEASPEEKLRRQIDESRYE